MHFEKYSNTETFTSILDSDSIQDEDQISWIWNEWEQVVNQGEFVCQGSETKF